MNEKSIGNFIAILRKANGMTQKQLAEKLCVSDKTVSRWERDETNPDLSLIPVIAEIFGVTSDELLRGKRHQTISAMPTADIPSEKQVQRLLSATKAKHITRIILSVAIALLGWIIAILMNHSYRYRDASIPVILVCTIIGIVCQLISSVHLFSAVHSEEFDGPQFNELKRNILNSTGIITGAITAVTVFLIPLLCVRLRNSFSNYDEMSGIVSGAVWCFVSILVWAILYLLIRYFLSEHGHDYLKS